MPSPQVFPRVSSRPPKLLEQLESILVDRLRNNDRAATTATLLTKDRDPGMAANLSIDAHRQVFAAFTDGFTTYTSLLARIQVWTFPCLGMLHHHVTATPQHCCRSLHGQEEFELALDQGLRCTMENVHMRIRIAEEEAKRSKARGETRSKIMAGEYRGRF